MKHLILLFIIPLLASCNQNATPQKEVNKQPVTVDKKTTTEAEASVNNDELEKLYKADQAARQGGNIDWKIVSVQDSLRQVRVYELLDASKVKTAADYHNAAMIFQHGRDTTASEMAVKMMKKAVELDSNINKWLLAAAIDRDLMKKKQPQIYGTQYKRPGKDEPWTRYDLDSTKVSDEERVAYGVPTLAGQKKKLKRMNMKKLPEMLSSGKSIDEVIRFCEEEDAETAEYNISEGGINSFGYYLMGNEKNEDALKVFELNTRLHPNKANTYDSLGECLLKLGRKEEGIKAYQKVLEFEPDNQYVKDILAKNK